MKLRGNVVGLFLNNKLRVMLMKKFAGIAAVVSLLGVAMATTEEDPAAVIAGEAAVAGDEVGEGEAIVHEEEGEGSEENVASRYLLAQLSIVQGLTERLSGELVAAVPEEVAESLKEVLAEAHALERMAIDVGAGEYEELLQELEGDPAVQVLYDKLDAATAKLEEKSYYNCPELEEVVSQILNIISDL